MTKISTLLITDKNYTIKADKQIVNYMVINNIDTSMINETVLSLGTKQIKKLSEQKDDAIIVDTANQMSLVLSFTIDTITILSIVPTQRTLKINQNSK